MYSIIFIIKLLLQVNANNIKLVDNFHIWQEQDDCKTKLNKLN